MIIVIVGVGHVAFLSFVLPRGEKAIEVLFSVLGNQSLIESEMA